MAWKDFSLKGEVVCFRATDGAVLSAMLSRPKGSRVAVLHLHGLNSAFYKPLSIRLGNHYAKKGITFMSIQQRGSYKEYSVDVIRGSKAERVLAGGGFEKFEDSVYDIEGAIKYLKSIGIKKVYLQGHSSGCQKSVHYMIKRKDKAVKGLVLLAPGDDLNVWKNTFGFNATLKLAKSKMRTDPQFRMDTKRRGVPYSARRFLSLADNKNIEARIFNYELPKLREFSKVKVPILAVFGSKDEYALKPPKKYLEILGENTGSPDFTGVVIKDSSHGFFRNEEKLAGLVGNWVLKIEGQKYG